MKRKIIFVGLLTFFVLFGVFVFIFEQKKENPQKPPKQLPIPTKVESNMLPTIPVNLEREKKLQDAYAFDRQDYLGKRPWILLLPLQSSSYFIFYDSEENEIVADVYYYPNSSFPKNLQLSLAKNDVIHLLKKIGVDLSKEKIVYIEKAR